MGYIHMEIRVGTEYTAPLNFYFRGLGDTGTAIKGYIYIHTGTDPTNPIHSHFWGRGDTGTLLYDI